MEKDLRDKFDRAGRDPGAVVARCRQAKGLKAIGLVHTDVPFELVRAAGALPVAVLAAEVPFLNADRHLQGFACTYSRSVVELAASGGLDWLDGIIVPYVCDTTRCLDLIFKHQKFMSFSDCLRLPKRTGAEGVKEYYPAELRRLAERLSAFTGVEVTEERLRDAISSYNRVRGLLERLREGRRWAGPVASLADYLAAVRAAMILPPEESIPLLESAVAEGPAGRGESDRRPRVVLAGKVCEPPVLAELLETAGLWIVEDHLAVGGRWAEAAVPESGDPWAALTERQLNLLPFAGIWDGRPSRASYLLERVKDLDARAAVFLVQKFCEPAELDYPGIKEELEREGVPLLALETDYRAESLGPVRTRVEAFAEMLRGS